MAVRIRLTRMGGKKRPFYRVVVADSESPRDGRFLEMVGTYDPTKNPARIDLNEAGILKWLGRGAEVSETVKGLLKKVGIKGLARCGNF